jgi:hypothetical protein
MIGTTDSKWTHEGEEPASEGRVYREVSFNHGFGRILPPNTEIPIPHNAAAIPPNMENRFLPFEPMCDGNPPVSETSSELSRPFAMVDQTDARNSRPNIACFLCSTSRQRRSSVSVAWRV